MASPSLALRSRAAPHPLLARLTARTVAQVVIVGLLLYLVLGPIALLLYSSFRHTNGALPFDKSATWSLSNYDAVFLSSGTYDVLWNTFVFGLSTLVVTFAISIGLAWLVERTDIPLRRTIYVLVVAQLGIPGLISTISWTFLLSPRTGYLNVMLRPVLHAVGIGGFNIYSMAGLVFVQALNLVPITFLLIAAGFRAMNVELEDAARASGARFRTVLRRVTLPVLIPALLSAFAYQFVSVVEAFDVPYVIGVRAHITVLSTRIFFEVQRPTGLPDYGLASGYAIFVIILVLIPLAYYNRVIAQSKRYATLGGRGFRETRYELGRWRIPALFVGLFVVAIEFILPLLSLVWTSLQPYSAAPSRAALDRASLRSYRALSSNSFFKDAFKNTLVLGITAGVASMLLAFGVAWIVVRTKNRATRLIDVVSFLPHALPEVIIGVAVLLIYLVLPGPIYGTIWLVVIGVSTQYLSLGTRLMTSAVAQVDQSLEEASTTCGARWWQTMRKITLPIVRPALVNGMLLVFLSAIKNLTMPLLLSSTGSNVLSTLVWVDWYNGLVQEAATVGVVMVAVTVVASLLLRRFGGVRYA